MKKRIFMILCTIFFITILVGCGKKEESYEVQSIKKTVSLMHYIDLTKVKEWHCLTESESDSEDNSYAKSWDLAQKGAYYGTYVDENNIFRYAFYIPKEIFNNNEIQNVSDNDALLCSILASTLERQGRSKEGYITLEKVWDLYADINEMDLLELDELHLDVPDLFNGIKNNQFYVYD